MHYRTPKIGILLAYSIRYIMKFVHLYIVISVHSYDSIYTGSKNGEYIYTQGEDQFYMRHSQIQYRGVSV